MAVEFVVVLGIIAYCRCTQANSDPVSPLFHCQFLSEESQLVYTPNIPDSYFNDSNAARFRTREGGNHLARSSRRTYIFTIPSESVQRNCSGRVVSIQYCYQARNGDIGQTRNIFNFLSLVQEPVQNRVNRVQFTVNSSITIQTTPQNSICTDPPGNIQQICCDTASLIDNDQFQIPLPPSNYTFGVRIINNNVRPLIFTSSVTEYHVGPSYIINNPPTSPGTMFILREGTNRPLLLLRFIIEQTTLAPTTAQTITPTTQQFTTDGVLITDEITTEEPNMDQVTTNAFTTMSSLNNLQVKGSDGTGGAVGGAVGGLVALLAIIASITCVVVVVVKSRSKQKPTRIQENDGMGFSNAIYEGVDSGTPAYKINDYADIGPETHVSAVEGDKLKEEQYFYADSGASYDVPSLCLPTEGANLSSTQWKDEDIYVVPAKDEHELYSQLQDIRIQGLKRHFVRLGDLLGSGQFGMVYKGVLQSASGEVEVAVKTLKEGSRKEDRVKFLQEAAIMGQFKHPNVVTMYGVVTDGEPILLVLELLRKGDLRDHLIHIRNGDKEGSINIDDHTLLSYCRQVASGMAYLSSKDFVHRDLAARNILVSDDEICKIADFGMSRDLMDESYYVSHGGKIPVKWTAPEALYYKKYSTASDVWSYGALLYEIWSVGHKPYEDYANSKVISLIDTGFRLSPPPGCPRALYNIMISCWHPVSSQRPNFMDITRQLSFPDTKLLKWSEEDKSVHPEATKLGADLLCAQELYKNLQTCYQKLNNKTDNISCVK